MNRNITDHQFEVAQKAELDNWKDQSRNKGRIRHELREHSDILAPFKKFVPPARQFKRGLDLGVGCFGLGFLGPHLRQRIGEIEGVDPLPLVEVEVDEPSLKQEIQEIRAAVKYRQGRGERIDAPDAHYDIISCINVVDHAQNPLQIVEEINRVLMPGGILLFSVSTLSFAGEWLWKWRRSRNPGYWLYVAHPHTYQWANADALVSIASARRWHDRPNLATRLLGHGRMSFWLVEKR